MDTNEKKIFVYELCNAIAAGIVANIDAGKIPEERDGLERTYTPSGKDGFNMIHRENIAEVREVQPCS